MIGAIIVSTIIGIIMLFLYCVMRISSIESRNEERYRDKKKKGKK